jgi:hypothetical protein
MVDVMAADWMGRIPGMVTRRRTCLSTQAVSEAEGTHVADIKIPTLTDVHRIFQHDIRSDIVLEVLIYIPEHIRHDVDGADVRSGRGSDLHTTAREAVVSVSFSAFAVLVTLKHR